MRQYVVSSSIPPKTAITESNQVLSVGSVAHLDLLPTALVLIHWLTGLHDGLPHI